MVCRKGKKERFIKLDHKIFAVLKSVADRLREKDTRYKPSDPRILEVSQGPLYRWNKYKSDIPKFRSLHIDIANKQVPIPEDASINIFGEELAIEKITKHGSVKCIAGQDMVFLSKDYNLDAYIFGWKVKNEEAIKKLENMEEEVPEQNECEKKEARHHIDQ